MRALCLVWTTPDHEVARNMVFMYGANSLIKGWWDSVRLLVWGPTAKLLAEDPGLRPDIEDLRAAGVELLACKACADRYGAAAALEDLGFRVLYAGEELTRMLQGGWTVLTV
ncbi:DsrE family protein [Desulfovibrio sp.]